MLNILWTISDIYQITRRNLLRYFRVPQLLIFSTIQPVMFVLLFAYVFGGAIKTNINYIEYLIPGILVQTVIFGSAQTGVGLADDLSKGMIDRLNSLPISRWAVLAGRTLADMMRNIFVVTLMLGVGYLIGFRFENGVFNALLAIFLVVLFGFAFSWISANIGLLVKDVETAQVAGFIWIFPFVFASSIFVPVETMPNWLQAFAKVSPVTLTVNAVRILSIGGDAFPDFVASFAWILGFLIFFAPIAVHRYRRI